MRSKARLSALAFAALALLLVASSTVLAASPATAPAAAPAIASKVSAILAHQEATLDRLRALTPKLEARVDKIPAGARHLLAQKRFDAFKAEVAGAQAAHDRLVTLAVGGITLAERPAARRDVAAFRLNAALARLDVVLIRWF